MAGSQAFAESPVCQGLQTEYVGLLRAAAPENIAALQKELVKAQVAAERGNCNRFFLFARQNPSCPAIKATVNSLQRQLAQSRGQAFGLFEPPPEVQRARYRDALAQNGCTIPTLSSPGRTLCVRTCDGYYFPISSRIASGRTKADTAACQSMYLEKDQATLYIQRGDDVATAVSVDGKKRYGEQPFAFLYRQTFDAACHSQLKAGIAAMVARAMAAPAAKEVPVALSTPPKGDAATAIATVALAPSVEPPQASPRPVRFVGDAYYADMFAYAAE